MMDSIDWLIDNIFTNSEPTLQQKIIINKAKEMMYNDIQEYLKFCLICKESEMEILKYEDYIKLKNIYNII
jgi:hypothetical protein